MALTQAQIEQDLRLGKIFMPYAMRQRDEAYKLQKEEGGGEDLRLAHYTTAEAGLNIITTKRLWMRNTTSMVDYREVQHGFDLLKAYFVPDKTKRFADELDKIVPGAAMDAINRFNGWWQNNLHLNIYAACVSNHRKKEDVHGRLSMWRAFGANSTRVAIVIKIPKYTESAMALGLMFSPVAYLTQEEVHSVIEEVISNVSKERAYLQTVPPSVVVNYLFSMLMAGVTCLKHEGFAEEHEWRAIYAPQLWPSNLMDTGIEVINGVPQHVHKIPLDIGVSPQLEDLDLARMIDRVIIGPSPYPWVIGNAFVDGLRKIGVPNPEHKVFPSGIPIRS